MNVNKLKGKITERGLSIKKLAGMIGVDRSSLYRKLGNAEKITIGEASKMKDALELTNEEASDIFFGNNVAYCATEQRCEACEAKQI